MRRKNGAAAYRRGVKSSRFPSRGETNYVITVARTFNRGERAPLRLKLDGAIKIFLPFLLFFFFRVRDSPFCNEKKTCAHSARVRFQP